MLVRTKMLTTLLSLIMFALVCEATHEPDKDPLAEIPDIYRSYRSTRSKEYRTTGGGRRPTCNEPHEIEHSFRKSSQEDQIREQSKNPVTQSRVAKNTKFLEKTVKEQRIEELEKIQDLGSCSRSKKCGGSRCPNRDGRSRCSKCEAKWNGIVALVHLANARGQSETDSSDKSVSTDDLPHQEEEKSVSGVAEPAETRPVGGASTDECTASPAAVTLEGSGEISQQPTEQSSQRRAKRTPPPPPAYTPAMKRKAGRRCNGTKRVPPPPPAPRRRLLTNNRLSTSAAHSQAA